MKGFQVRNMNKLRGWIAGIAALVLPLFPVQAEEVSRGQIKGLDEQIQEIKSDVLGIATELNRLEEKLLFPSQTQVAVFLSLDEGESFRLDSATIVIDGDEVAEHLYTFKELEALRKGGVQRIYTGNLKTGEHALQVTYRGKTEGGSDLQRSEDFAFRKNVGPGIVEISLTQGSVAFRER